MEVTSTAPAATGISSHAVMCQAGPTNARSLPPRPPCRPLHPAARVAATTFIINGTADTVVDIPHHGPDFFADLRQRVIALNGSRPRRLHHLLRPGRQPSPVLGDSPRRRLAQLGTSLSRMARQRSRRPPHGPASVTGLTQVGASFSKNYDRNDRDAGIIAVAAGVPHLTVEQLDVLPCSEWDQHKSDFIYATWLQRAAAAASAP